MLAISDEDDIPVALNSWWKEFEVVAHFAVYSYRIQPIKYNLVGLSAAQVKVGNNY